MRNDVKFGLSIGGILVLVLIIWVAVVNRSNKKLADNTSGDGVLAPRDEGTADGAATAETSGTVQPGGPTPVSPITPLEAAKPAGHLLASDRGAATHTNLPALGTNPDRQPKLKATDWNAILASGQVPARDVVQTSYRTGGGENTPIDMLQDRGSASSSGSSPTTQPLNGQRTYKVESGDTFYVISTNVYGTSRYWKRLVTANPQVNPNRLRVGTVLQVPEVGSVNGTPRSVSESSITSSVSTPAATDVANRAPAALDRSTSYRVQSNDTLIRIARKLYGSDIAWEKLYQANKDVIGTNPAALKVDMVLRLPSPPTVASVN